MPRKFHLNMRKKFTVQWPSTGTDHPERAWSLPHWRCSRTIWMQSCAMCSGMTLLEQAGGTWWPTVVPSHPTHCGILLPVKWPSCSLREAGFSIPQMSDQTDEGQFQFSWIVRRINLYLTLLVFAFVGIKCGISTLWSPYYDLKHFIFVTLDRLLIQARLRGDFFVFKRNYN